MGGLAQIRSRSFSIVPGRWFLDDLLFQTFLIPISWMYTKEVSFVWESILSFIFKCKLLREKAYFFTRSADRAGAKWIFFYTQNLFFGSVTNQNSECEACPFFFIYIVWFSKTYHMSSALGHGGYHIFILFLAFWFLACLYMVICLCGNLFSFFTHLFSLLQFLPAYIQALL